VRFVVSATPQKAARAAARAIARRLAAAVEERGVATVALSGGASAPALLAELARMPVEWGRVRVFQVDERIAPAGDAARNLAALEAALLAPGRLARERLHAMPVETTPPEAAAVAYAAELARHAGEPPVLDVVQLGLGADGHTASLFAGDPAFESPAGATVACTGEQHGHRRLTLTLPVLSAARAIVWFAHGAAKAGVLALLATRGWRAPAGRVARRQAVVYADRAGLEVSPAA
jgi:6-phosphogluconolactonase